MADILDAELLRQEDDAPLLGNAANLGHIRLHDVEGAALQPGQEALAPGQHFEYSSSASISTPVGTMHGSYQMVADDGANFDAPIAPFRLAKPGVLN
jgi:ApaG protein